MKIINLFAENIKKIKVVDITPENDVVIIEGKNAQGKSSVMDTISMALGGEKLIPIDPVRHGEERAAIKLDLGEVIVKRTWKKADSGSVLEIKTKDGEKVRSPQEWLNDKLKLATLDPSVFIKMKPVERVEELKKIPGLDCSQEDTDYMKEYDARTLVNRDLDTAKKSLSEYEGLVMPKDLRSVPEIQKEIDAVEKKNKSVREHNAEISLKRDDLAEMDMQISHSEELSAKALENYNNALDEINQAETVIKQQQERISKLRELANHHSAQSVRLKDESNDTRKKKEILAKEIELSMPLEELSTERLKTELLASSELSAIAEKISRKKTLEKNIADYEDEVQTIEKRMVAIKKKKKDKFSAFNMPVSGLEVGEKDLMFNGITFDNLSQAQKISVSMALAIAQNPTLKIIKVAEGSLFDESTLKLVINFAKQNDFQVWIERVADNPTGTGSAIFIEDGEIVK